jgi:hypothetical protein
MQLGCSLNMLLPWSKVNSAVVDAWFRTTGCHLEFGGKKSKPYKAIFKLK